MKTFEVTKDHLKLLRRANISWDDCEFGAPCIDPKRPYGNSDVFEDMIEILGKRGEKFSEDTLRLLHLETQTVLQIALFTGKFKEGIYEAEDYSRNWKKI